MNNIIITETSCNLRMLGRQALAGKWKVAIIAMLIYQVCITLPALILDQLFGVSITQWSAELYNSMAPGMGQRFVEGVGDSAAKISTMSGIYIILVTGAFTLGLTIFFINLFRRRELDVAQVFSGFEQFFKALGLLFMIGLFTFLWTLLFIIPGIIAALRYSQAFFLLADDPNKGIMECINESKWLMRGNKGKYFCMQISFIGWLLLTAVAIGFLNTFFLSLVGGNVLYLVIDWLLGLGMCWVSTYVFATEAAFYDILKGNLKANTYIPGQY